MSVDRASKRLLAALKPATDPEGAEYQITLLRFSTSRAKEIIAAAGDPATAVTAARFAATWLIRMRGGNKGRENYELDNPKDKEALLLMLAGAAPSAGQVEGLGEIGPMPTASQLAQEGFLPALKVAIG